MLQLESDTGFAGIVHSIGVFVGNMFSNNAAKQLASVALQVGKTAAKYSGMKAIDVGKTVAIVMIRNYMKRLLKDYPQHNGKWLILWFHKNKLLKC